MAWHLLESITCYIYSLIYFFFSFLFLLSQDIIRIITFLYIHVCNAVHHSIIDRDSIYPCLHANGKIHISINNGKRGGTERTKDKRMRG